MTQEQFNTNSRNWRCNYCGASRTLSYRPMAGECGARPKKVTELVPHMFGHAARIKNKI